MKYSLNSREIPLILITIIFVVVVTCYLGTSYSMAIPIGLVCAFLFIVYYALNINKTFWNFMLIIPFLPPYFAIQIGSLPVLTAFRAMVLLFIVDQLIIKRRLLQLIGTIQKDKLTPIVLIYSIGVMIPGFHRLNFQDITGFIGSFAIILEKVFLYYLIQMNIIIEINKNGKEIFLNKFLHTVCVSGFVLSLCGILEFVTHFNVFHLLAISKVEGISDSSSSYMRAGNLRVSTSFIHALGYGLYLLLVIPIAYYQAKTHKRKNKNNYFFYNILLFLLVLNVLLTYSRSTLIALACVSFVVFFLFSNLKKKIIIVYSLFFLVVPIAAFSLTPDAENIPIMSTISQNTKALSDTFFGTQLVQNYGDNTKPFSYRNELIDFAFKEQVGDENIFGKGVGFIRTQPLIFNLPELNPYGPTISTSVDNYYANVKLELGWIGFIANLLFLVVVLFLLLKYRKKHSFFTVLLVSFSGYLFELTMVNELNTMVFFWIFLAVFTAFISNEEQNEIQTQI